MDVAEARSMQVTVELLDVSCQDIICLLSGCSCSNELGGLLRGRLGLVLALLVQGGRLRQLGPHIREELL